MEIFTQRSQQSWVLFMLPDSLLSATKQIKPNASRAAVDNLLEACGIPVNKRLTCYRWFGSWEVLWWMFHFRNDPKNKKF